MSEVPKIVLALDAKKSVPRQYGSEPLYDPPVFEPIEPLSIKAPVAIGVELSRFPLITDPKYPLMLGQT